MIPTWSRIRYWVPKAREQRGYKRNPGEAGLQEWMRFEIFRARSRKRLQRHFQADLWGSVASHCVSQWKLNCCVCKNYKEKVTENGEKKKEKKKERKNEKCVYVIFRLTRRSRVRGKNKFFCHPVERATSYCLLLYTFWLRTFKNAFKVGTVNFTNLLSTPSIVKKVCTGSKNSQGT